MTVFVGYAAGGSVTTPFHLAMVDLVLASMRRAPSPLSAHTCAQGPYIPRNRNMIVDRFLARDDCEWLWFVDTDMTVRIEHLDGLLSVADPDKRPVVAALYIGTSGNPMWTKLTDDGLEEQFLASDLVGSEHVHDNLAAVGMGCTLIHKSVFHSMVDADTEDDPWCWYGHDLVTEPDGTRTRVGEDRTFCLRARKLGINIAGAEIVVPHLKTVPIGLT